jgi:membrane protease subunit HflK
VHRHWPYPVEGVVWPKVTEVRHLEIGFRSIDLGSPARYVQVPSAALMLTEDENIVDINLAVQ